MFHNLNTSALPNPFSAYEYEFYVSPIKVQWTPNTERDTIPLCEKLNPTNTFSIQNA